MKQLEYVNISNDLQRAIENRNIWDAKQAQELANMLQAKTPSLKLNWDGPELENWGSASDGADRSAFFCTLIPFLAATQKLLDQVADALPDAIVAISFSDSHADEFICDLATLRLAFPNSILHEENYLDDKDLKPFSIADLYFDTVA